MGWWGKKSNFIDLKLNLQHNKVCKNWRGPNTFWNHCIWQEWKKVTYALANHMILFSHSWSFLQAVHWAPQSSLYFDYFIIIKFQFLLLLFILVLLLMYYY